MSTPRITYPPELLPAILATIHDSEDREVGRVELQSDRDLSIRITICLPDYDYLARNFESQEIIFGMDRILYAAAGDEYVPLETKLKELSGTELRLRPDPEGLDRAQAAEIWLSYYSEEDEHCGSISELLTEVQRSD